MEKLNVPCVVQEIETPLGIVRVTDRTGKTIPMHVCRNGVDIDYPIPGTEENLQEVPVPENHYWLMLDENDLEEGELYQIALETDKVRCYEHYDPECGGMALLASAGLRSRPGRRRSQPLRAAFRSVGGAAYSPAHGLCLFCSG